MSTSIVTLSRTSSVEDVEFSMKSFLDRVQVWRSNKTRVSPRSEVSKEIEIQLQRFAAAYEDALNAAQEGSATASKALTLSNIALKSEEAEAAQQHLDGLNKISRRVEQLSQNAFAGFQGVQKGFKELSTTQSNSEEQDSLQLGKSESQANTNSSLLDEFEALTNLYGLWWMAMVMSKCGRKPMNKTMAREKGIFIYIKFLKSKWQKLEDDFAQYAKKMQEIHDRYIDIFNEARNFNGPISDVSIDVAPPSPPLRGKHEVVQAQTQPPHLRLVIASRLSLTGPSTNSQDSMRYSNAPSSAMTDFGGGIYYTSRRAFDSESSAFPYRPWNLGTQTSPICN